MAATTSTSTRRAQFPRCIRRHLPRRGRDACPQSVIDAISAYLRESNTDLGSGAFAIASGGDEGDRRARTPRRALPRLRGRQE
jgi:hypothetical protein